MSRVLVWLRGDLRLADNPLLHFEHPPESLLCVYVLDRDWLRAFDGGVTRMGPARLRFLWESLIALRGELLSRGSDLLVRLGDPVAEVARLVERHRIDQVSVRRDAGWEESQAVSRLARCLDPEVRLWCPDGGTLFDETRLPIAVEALPPSFSAFRRRAERHWVVPSAMPAPISLPPWPETASRGLPPLTSVCTEAAGWRPDRRGEFDFVGGEAAGRERLAHYLALGGPGRYKQTRNGLCGPDFSTRLSPWLAHGCLSARQVHDAVRAWENHHGASDSSYWIVFELLWRDYFHWAAHQEGAALYGPRPLPAVNEALETWRRGRTGMPLVDAAMRELAATGWLSNRARQNAASYLVHELGGDWRLGAAWFERCLIDYDAASNWGNWRYVAGVGRDRRGQRFDVSWQAERYDPRGHYVTRWLST
ncbi:DASH family cryptochrome [Halomonas marinisediminis]|uniref:Cryptochrome DASH n=1 Tax=Halomonas marinisediminis TaxID=2546095 RepID=A0ABY2D5E2_9GAMM|nr:DASH family cryptochrome [Halomonas marinisediminis]TDB01487.1 DASH family cryptochrome [Halomonas marinisediminis]